MRDKQLSQSNVDKCHQIIEDSSKLFTTPLQEPWARTRTPYGLDAALEALQSTPGGTQLATNQDQDQVRRLETEQIFWGAGFQAWLTYFLTTRNQGYHFTGQKSSRQTLDAFHSLSRADRTKVARAVAGTKCHETVEKAITNLMASRKRQRLMSGTYGEESSDYATNATMSSLPSVVESLPPTDSAMTASTTHTNATMPSLQSVVEGLPLTDNAMTASATHTNTTMSSLQSVVEGLPPTDSAMTASTTPGTLGINAASDPAAAFIQAQTSALGSFRGLMNIFPPYLCGAVSAKDGKADVTMDFPYVRKHGLKLHCLMSLVIKASEIPFITWRLFQVQIGTGDDGLRHQVLGNGGRGLARQGFQFQGSLDGDIDSLLGSKVLKAIAKSPVRDEELDVGITATRCVTISFSDNSLDNGLLNLSLGLEHGLWMREKLFG